MYTKDDITPEIREKSRMVLGYIKIKIVFKRKDLLRKMYKEQDRFYLASDEVFANIPNIFEDQRSSTWEFQLDNPDLIDAMMSLSGIQQRVLWKLYIEGNNQVDIAEQLGISPAAVSKAKKRALKELNKKIKKN